jgi:hypothetical protein
MDVVAYCYGALSAHVTNTMDGYHGTDEQTLVLLKVGYLILRHLLLSS